MKKTLKMSEKRSGYAHQFVLCLKMYSAIKRKSLLDHISIMGELLVYGIDLKNYVSLSACLAARWCNIKEQNIYKLYKYIFFHEQI